MSLLQWVGRKSKDFQEDKKTLLSSLSTSQEPTEPLSTSQESTSPSTSQESTSPSTSQEPTEETKFVEELTEETKGNETKDFRTNVIESKQDDSEPK